MNKAFDEAWADVVAALEVEMENVIRDPDAFADIGFVDQDIVDTERFVKSQQVQVKGRKVTFIWNPRDPKTGYEYAPALYYGFFAFGRKYIRGRRWPERACDRVDIPTTLKDGIVRRGVKAKVKLKKKVET